MSAHIEGVELELDTEMLNRIDTWRNEHPDLPSRSEAGRLLIEAGLNSVESEKLFQMARFNLLVASKMPGPSEALSDAYVYAWYAKVYPLFDDGADLHVPFADRFRVTQAMMDELTEYLDDSWKKGQVPTFYRLEDHYKVRSGQTAWDRGQMIVACRYIFHSDSFDEQFWSSLLQSSDHPSEAKSIVRKFASDQIHLN